MKRSKVALINQNVNLRSSTWLWLPNAKVRSLTNILHHISVGLMPQIGYKTLVLSVSGDLEDVTTGPQLFRKVSIIF